MKTYEKMIAASNALFLLLMILDLTGLIVRLPFEVVVAIYALLIIMVIITIILMVKSPKD
jgi:hypothetical protein